MLVFLVVIFNADARGNRSTHQIFLNPAHIDGFIDVAAPYETIPSRHSGIGGRAYELGLAGFPPSPITYGIATTLSLYVNVGGLYLWVEDFETMDDGSFNLSVLPGDYFIEPASLNGGIEFIAPHDIKVLRGETSLVGIEFY